MGVAAVIATVVRALRLLDTCARRGGAEVGKNGRVVRAYAGDELADPLTRVAIFYAYPMSNRGAGPCPLRRRPSPSPSCLAQAPSSPDSSRPRIVPRPYEGRVRDFSERVESVSSREEKRSRFRPPVDFDDGCRKIGWVDDSRRKTWGRDGRVDPVAGGVGVAGLALVWREQPCTERGSRSWCRRGGRWPDDGLEDDAAAGGEGAVGPRGSPGAGRSTTGRRWRSRACCRR